MKNELSALKGRIFFHLATDEAARNSDDYLYYLLCVDALDDNGIDINNISLKDGILGRKVYNLPNYETVRRTRQKIQQVNECLRPSDETKKRRRAREAAWRKFARGEMNG